MKPRHLRLAAGTLALVLPLAAVAACGADKKRTIRQELASAEAHLNDSRAASFTLRMDDSRGTLAALATKGGDAMPKAVADALLRGSVTYVVDPAGDATFKSASSRGTTSLELKENLKKVNLGFVIRDDKAVVAELRLVAGDLYAKVDLEEVGRLAELGGAKDFDAELDRAVADMGPGLKALVKDARAGRFIKLPVAKYLDQMQDLAGAMPTPQPKELEQLGNGLLRAVKPHVKVTDANDDSDNRVLDVKVRVRPALKAALAVLKAEQSLPFLGTALSGLSGSDVDQSVRDGEARGTITLKDGHLTQLAVDLESIRLLDVEESPSEDSVAGSRVVFDVDDDADQVQVPADVSTVDVAEIIDGFMEMFMGGFTGSSELSMESSYTG